MERENRRNSILKPVGQMNPSSDCADEESTENFTFSRRKSYIRRRVSFAEHNEIKEFQKHEVLTVEKLEKALTQRAKESEHNEDIQQSVWHCEKENMQHKMPEENEISNQFNVDMEITTLTSADNDVDESKSNDEQTDMEVSAISTVAIHETVNKELVVGDNPVLTKVFPNSFVSGEHFSGEQTLVSPSIQEIEMSAAMEEENIEQEEICIDKTIGLISPATVLVAEERIIETCSLKAAGKSYNDQEFQPTQQESFFEGITIPSQDFSTDESNGFLALTKEFKWKVEILENELSLLKINNYITLKLKLEYEYFHQNVKHYIVEDIEIDTKKDMEDKWARFGMLVLENTLEHCNLRGICSSTQDLSKLLLVIEEYSQSLLEFVLEDSPKFEMLANPRSIIFDTDDSRLTFELSNLENLFWVRITLNLIPLFPLVAKEVTIESILGSVNISELKNMISTIRPKGLYLTRIAECIEDFLKFRTTSNERKTLNLTNTN